MAAHAHPLRAVLPTVRRGFATLGFATLFVGCCGGFVVYWGIVSAISLPVLLGAGTGVILAVALVQGVVLVIQARRRQACEVPQRGAAS
jgi:hypothetical protein